MGELKGLSNYISIQLLIQKLHAMPLFNSQTYHCTAVITAPSFFSYSSSSAMHLSSLLLIFFSEYFFLLFFFDEFIVLASCPASNFLYRNLQFQSARVQDNGEATQE
ncbi:hypothetical protein LINPERPRIM_LOCUS29152 [Linum perenne]